MSYNRLKKRHRPEVAVKMVGVLPYWIEKLTNLGSCCKCKPWNSRCRFQVKWTAVNREAEKFLRIIIPYLRLKQKQAKLVLDYYKKDSWGCDQSIIVKKITALNKRGV